MAANAMNDIYTKVCTALNTLSGTVKWFEVDMNQTKKDGESLPSDFPAVFFKHEDVLWENTPAPQCGVVAMEMQIIHQVSDNQELLKPQATGRQDVIRRNIDLVDINNAIAGLNAPTFNRILRLNSKEEFVNENMTWKHTINYYCNIMSDASAPPAGFTIDFNYVTDMNQLLNHNKCCK